MHSLPGGGGAMTTHVLAPIERHRAYSTSETAAYLGISAADVRDRAALGEFGRRGAWSIDTPGGRVHAIRVAGWAIEEWIAKHAIGGHR